MLMGAAVLASKWGLGIAFVREFQTDFCHFVGFSQMQAIQTEEAKALGASVWLFVQTTS